MSRTTILRRWQSGIRNQRSNRQLKLQLGATADNLRRCTKHGYKKDSGVEEQRLNLFWCSLFLMHRTERQS